MGERERKRERGRQRETERTGGKNRGFKERKKS